MANEIKNFKDLKVGDEFTEVLPNGYIADFKVVSIGDDKNIVSERIRLYKTNADTNSAPSKAVEEPKEEVKVETSKETPKKPVKKATTAKRK